jgi:hypothetical protein
MPVSLEFSVSHRYNSSADGIEVPVTLRIGGQSVDLTTKLDTGAAYCIFDRRYAEMLRLDVESGRLQRFRTATGSFAAYEHEVTLQTLGIAFSKVVFFAEDPAFTWNFLGRTGWLDRLRVAIIDHDLALYLGEYDSERPPRP